MKYLICGAVLTLLSCGLSWSEDSNPPANGSGTEQVKTQKQSGQKYLRLDTSDRACLKLRTYKVKATERLKDGESGMVGYATCVAAGEFQMRSADIRVKEEAHPAASQ